MTSPLRRKRPTTALRTPPTTRSIIAGLSALTFAAIATCTSFVEASEQTAGAAQWRARGLNVSKPSRPAVIQAIAARPADTHGAPGRLQWSSSKFPDKKLRALDGAVRPAQHEAPAAPALDAPSAPEGFAADAQADVKSGEAAAAATPPESKGDIVDEAAAPQAKSPPPVVRASQPTGEPTMPADDLFKDSQEMKPAEDLYKDDPIPTPPDRQLPTSPGDMGTGIETPAADVGCKGYSKECKTAIAELQRRDITTIFVGLVIEGTEGEDFPCDCKLGRDFDSPQFAGRNFTPTLFAWKASGTCHKPLYFEDVQLERYGHSWNPILQPFVSGAHFFVSVPLLPYKMGLNPKHECIYTLGYYRPGNCAPYMFEPIPFSLRAALFEAAGATAFAFWFWPPN